jgi:hypothetical protein
MLTPGTVPYQGWIISMDRFVKKGTVTIGTIYIDAHDRLCADAVDGTNLGIFHSESAAENAIIAYDDKKMRDQK